MTCSGDIKGDGDDIRDISTSEKETRTTAEELHVVVARIPGYHRRDQGSIPSPRDHLGPPYNFYQK